MAVLDMLSNEITVEYLVDLFVIREEEIKYVMMDQKLIRRVGEAYADEILWYAEKSPFSIAGKIPFYSIKVLYKTIQHVVLDAIKEARKITTTVARASHSYLDSILAILMDFNRCEILHNFKDFLLE